MQEFSRKFLSKHPVDIIYLLFVSTRRVIFTVAPNLEQLNSFQREIITELGRIQFEMTNRNIRVKFLQDFAGFSFENIKIPASQKGSQIEVPYFIAKIFQGL